MRKIIRGNENDDIELGYLGVDILHDINYSSYNNDIPGEYENGMLIFFKLAGETIYPAFSCLESFEEIGKHFSMKCDVSSGWSSLARENTIHYIKESQSNVIYVCNMIQDMRIDDFDEFLEANMDHPPTIEKVEDVLAGYLINSETYDILEDSDFVECGLYKIEFQEPLTKVFNKYHNVQHVRNALVLLRGMMDSERIATKEDLYEDYLEGTFKIPEGIEY